MAINLVAMAATQARLEVATEAMEATASTHLAILKTKLLPLLTTTVLSLLLVIMTLEITLARPTATCQSISR